MRQIFPFRLKLTCIVEKIGMRQNRKETDMRKNRNNRRYWFREEQSTRLFKCSVRCGDLPVRSGGTSGTASGRKMLSEGRGDVWKRNFKIRTERLTGKFLAELCLTRRRNLKS